MTQALTRRWSAALLLLELLVLFACNSAARSVDAGQAESNADAASEMADASSASSASLERPMFCERDGGDPVRDVFCADELPTVSGLQDLQELFGLDARGFDPQKSEPFDFDPTRDVAVLGHSTALAGHRVSPINPRLVLLGEDVNMTFQRGGQQVELVTRAREGNELVFYLLTFEQACSESRSGCAPSDLYTARVEDDWTRLKVEDDEELKNTPSDCRQCHRRGTESAMLLMRELESPWTHFMFPADLESPSPDEIGSALMRDYLQAKGDESYGGVDMQQITLIGPFNLQIAIGPEQPLLFNSSTIENERWPWLPEGGYASQIQSSPTWENAYAAFKRGEQLALPYLELRATDPDKQAALAEAYQKYQAGEIEADELPDLGDIFPDDPGLRARIGLATEPDASPAEALIQACGSCHNDVLDQSISRARFTIALARLDRAELDLAIERIELPRSAPGAMPPPEARQLTSEARQRLLDYLRSDIDRDAVDSMLERAAMLGMTGGGNIGMAGDLVEEEQF